MAFSQPACGNAVAQDELLALSHMHDCAMAHARTSVGPWAALLGRHEVGGGWGVPLADNPGWGAVESVACVLSCQAPMDVSRDANRRGSDDGHDGHDGHD
ncbi:hypothetical protein LTR39_005756, partial [Cryomyces antarcticus]